MSDLLDLAIEAHGGWQRWSQLSSLSSHLSVGGAILPVKGVAGMLADSTVRIDTRQPHTEYMPFMHPGQRGVWDPGRTQLLDEGGQVLSARDDPRAAFAGHSIPTPWDAHHALYFSGYAIWTYLSTPFLFRMPGFDVREVEPYEEDGEVWRRLRVRFPDHVPSHCAEQTFYFDDKGWLRRQDYSVDVMGGTNSANYAYDHQLFDGLLLPTKRRVYSIGQESRPILERVAISIDFFSFELT